MKTYEFKQFYPSKVYTLKGEDITEEALPLYKIRLNVKILLDEMCMNLKNILSANGFDVITVTEVLDIMPNNKSVKDIQILSYACRENVLLVTKDRALRNKCNRNKVPCIDLESTLIETMIIRMHINYMRNKKLLELKKLQENI